MNVTNFHYFLLGFTIGIWVVLFIMATRKYQHRIVRLLVGLKFYWDFKFRKISMERFVQERADEGYDILKVDNRIEMTKGEKRFVLTLAKKQ